VKYFEKISQKWVLCGLCSLQIFDGADLGFERPPCSCFSGIFPEMLNWMFRYCCFCVLLLNISPAQAQRDGQNLSVISRLRTEKITEQQFRNVCDLMQFVAKTDLDSSYAIFKAYLPRVRATGNIRWIHILLMGWARAKESLNYFEDAQELYREARDNAAANPRYYRESLTGTILLYLEWGKQDSLHKYLAISERNCLESGDSENLSFAYTFRAMSRLDNPDTMKNYLTRAIQLARDLPDKNALFTARYNYAVIYCQNNLVREVSELESLLQLAKDSSLNQYPPRLYNRTNFSFRNAKSSIYYNLMQVNLLLTDYDQAEKFAELFYNAVISPDPDGVQAPYFNAEMAIVKCYHRDYTAAGIYLEKSRRQFNMAEDKIPYISYFIAAGLLAEKDKNYQKALQYYQRALEKGNTQGLYIIPPEIYYAHVLILTGDLPKAGEVLREIEPRLKKDLYSATGFYYYKYYAELLQARNNYKAYAGALRTFYQINDSLTNLKRYRAITEVEAKYRVKEEQEKIAQLQKAALLRMATVKRERNFYISLICLACLSILLLAFNLHQRRIRNRQQEALQQSKIEQMEEQHRNAVMQGVMEAEEKERSKIADQLHDDVGAMLSLASLNISSVLEKGSADPQAEKKLNKTREILSSVSVSVRDLSHRLTPLMIEKFGFRKAVENLCEAINLSEKIELETIFIGFETPSGYSLNFFNHLFRLIQELLNNILKHAKATHAMLELVEHSDHISLIVEDNGTGISDASLKNNHSPSSIQAKIAYLKGAIEITGNQEGGTLVVVEIPVNH
jgi:signal transduction histidine kinase